MADAIEIAKMYANMPTDGIYTPEEKLLEILGTALLAQQAVVEAAEEQERQRFLADEARAARQDLETQAQHTEDYRSACRTTNAAVRAMMETKR